MGLFGPKIPKEEKEYRKALKSALLHPKARQMEALRVANQAYPAGWQGYWLSWLYYDIGFGKTSPDPEKAQEYLQKAEASVRGTNAEEWLTDFVLWYRKEAGNLYKTLTPKQEKVRRMGVAMLQTWRQNLPMLTGIYGNYDDNWELIGILRTALDYDNETNAFCDFWSMPTYDATENYKETSKFLKKMCHCGKTFKKCMKALNADNTPNWEDLNDMYSYVYAFNCLNGGPILTASVSAETGLSEATLGIKEYLHAALYGNQPAVHELVRLACASEEDFEFMNRIYCEYFILDDLNVFLLDCLKRCMEKNDQEASRLFDCYFAARLS